MRKFENYRNLPRSAERALEVGCGPYTNIRLISHKCKIKEIYCCDPLIDIYTSFKSTWLSAKFSRKRIKVFDYKCAKMNFGGDYFDLVICVNVLDHVQNAEECLKEMIRVTQKGDVIVLGQDLSDEDDLSNKIVRDDVGHPIKIHHTTLDAFFDSTYAPLLRKVLPRDEGRNPPAHYGTYIFIGQKK